MNDQENDQEIETSPAYEVWAEKEGLGWTVGLTDHRERFVSMVRKGLPVREATAYKNRLVVLAFDLAAAD